MPDDLTGRKIGPYEVVELIGEGGMAQVYRAFQPSIGREVAIKVLPATFTKDATFVERFNREVRLIAQLQHPRILPVHDYGEFEGRPYIVMALMTGGSLEARIRQEEYGLPISEVMQYMAQLAEALDFAHGKGIVHRDFKPANVLLDAQGNCYLADFGIARAVEGTSQLTGTGLVGTPAYMAPEMAGETVPGQSVDIYALGVTLYQMLAGKVPYTTTNPMGVLMAHLSEPIPDVLERRSELPPEIQTVIEKGMAKKPEDRYPSAGELAADLYLAATTGLGRQIAEGDAAATAAHPLSVDDVLTPTRPAQKRSFPAWIVAVGGLALIGVVVLGIVLSGGRGAASGVIPTDTPPLPSDTPPPTDTPAPTDTPVEAAPPVIVESPTPTVPPSETPVPTATLLGGSAGGGRILFSTFRDGSGELYLMTPDGSGLTRLTTNDTNDTSPVWSLDGEKIAYVSFASGDQDIYLMTAGIEGAARITDNPNDDLDPSFSPDGRRIVFATNRDGNFELYVMNSDGSGRFRLTDDPAIDREPRWSPDGSRILFTSTRDGDEELYVMDSDGTNLVQLSDNAARDLNASWSADSSRIVFASNRDGGGDLEIYLISADGSDPIRLTEDHADDSQPALSPDGLWIVFVSQRDGNPEIYLIAVDGRVPPQRLTENLASDSAPQWEP